MAKNSLFAILLRSAWWVSLLIALLLALLSAALLPEGLRVVGAMSGLPFVVISAMVARRQWRLPSAARVAQTESALTTMNWSSFSALLEQAFTRDGFAVQLGKSEGKGEGKGEDFELSKGGRRMLVSARRWKSARTGLEALRTLQAAREASEAEDALYIGLAPLSDSARAYAAEQGIAIWQSTELAQALRGLPLAGSATLPQVRPS